MKSNEEIAREIIKNADIQVHQDFPGGIALPDSIRPDIVKALETVRRETIEECAKVAKSICHHEPDCGCGKAIRRLK